MFGFIESSYADNTVHNLNEYLEIHAADVPTSVGDDMINAVLTEKHGVVISENQVEDFFSLFSQQKLESGQPSS